MAVRRLPKELISRLRRYHAGWGLKKTSKKIPGDAEKKVKTNSKHVFDKLEIIDWRRNSVRSKFPTNQFFQAYGLRVREMNVSRNYPNVGKVVLKRIHQEETIQKIKRTLSQLRRAHFINPARRYQLKMPIFYKIDEQTIAMAKTSKPSLGEFFKNKHQVSLLGLESITPSAKNFYQKLKKQHGFSDLDFVSAVQELQKMDRKTTKINFSNFLLLGFEKEKFVFMPLPDTF